MTRTVDLHIHTCFSDGADTPERVVAIAVEKELCCIAVTDHDILDGIEPAIQAAEGTGLEVIPGVELSTQHSGADIHILGYCFDCHDPVMRQKLRMFQDTRMSRVKMMASRLRELGMDITDGDIFSLAGSDAIGRPHIAQALVNKGYVRTAAQAFDEYIAEGKPAYVEKFKQTPYEAIALIR